ncbi:probable G-protein coupled receptor 139 [Liolophura sinensis]|uniref:probable G-protein coupled receptor 139 n=1 Tax=Liolophura sinensis TaxID=3198878 RepID=UPI0031582380
MDLTLDPGRNNGSWFNIADSNASADVFGNLTIPPHQYYATELWKYFPPILILLGTFGNILTILILCRKSMWKMSSSPYLVVLGVADIVVLYTGLLRQWLRYVVDTDIRELSPVVCRLHIFSVYVSIDYSVWILVAVSVERFIGVCFPFKAKTFCTRRRTQITLFVIFCLLAILNSHFFFGFGSSFDNSTGVPVLISHCTVLTNEYALFTENIWPWVDLAVFSMIPFCLIIVCNISLIFRVVYSRRRHRVAPTDAHTTSGVSTSSMTALLISLNTLFLFTTAPISIYLIGYPRWSRTADYNEFALLNLCWAIVNFLMYLNNSLNFILYCLSGPRFRREIKLICARRHKVGVLKLTMPKRHVHSKGMILKLCSGLR